MRTNIVHNGSKVLKLENGKWEHYVTIKADDLVLEVELTELVKINKVIEHLKRNQKTYTAAVLFLAMWLDGGVSFAAGNISGGQNIILLMQKAAFWIGMGVSIWGVVEAQLDLPGWRGRIAKGVLGYVAILIIPLIFVELSNSLSIDVWNEIGGMGK